MLKFVRQLHATTFVFIKTIVVVACSTVILPAMAATKNGNDATNPLKQLDNIALSASQYREEWFAIGLSTQWQWREKWRPRVVLDYADYERNRTISTVAFKENLGQLSIGVLLDRPFKQWGNTELYWSVGAFHLFAGPEFKAEPNTDFTYTLNGHLYSGEHLSGSGAEVTYPLLSPYLGLGLRSNFSKNKKWFYQLDAGVVFNAQAEVKATTSNPHNLAFLEQDLQVEIDKYVEELKRKNDYFDDVFPRVSLTIGYSF